MDDILMAFSDHDPWLAKVKILLANKTEMDPQNWIKREEIQDSLFLFYDIFLKKVLFLSSTCKF